MPIIKNAKLRDFAYYATGGTCDVLYAPATIEELAATVREIAAKRQPWFLLGGGTNSLVSDEHFPGAVIMFRGLDRLERRGNTLICGAGVENTVVAKLALTHSLDGAAWMNRLPGQMGGTVRMNARCYGGEISQIATQVTVVTAAGDIKVYRDPSVFKGYKDTIFMSNGDLIAEVELSLSPGDPKAIEAQMLFCEKDREGKGQFAFPSCGCVFKNDYAVGVSSGMLLEKAGVKTFKHAGAEICPFHANFVYNKGATSRAILEISFKMRTAVYQTFGAWLEYEMEVLGNLPADLKREFDERKAHKLDVEALTPLRARMVAATKKV